MSDIIDGNVIPFAFEGKACRVALINGEPWWVLADVCTALGLSNPTVVASRIDEDERAKLDLGPSAMGATIINESGLYNVILRSDKPEAKTFKKWITSDVLPSIRKHGVYATPETIDKIIADPDFGIRLLSTLKEERSARIAAQAELVIAAPKIESFEALMRSEQTMSITDAAKHFGLHPKTEVFPYLRELRYLTREDLPTQAAIDAEYLALRETKCADGEVRRQSVVLASQLDTWRVRVVPQIRAWMGEGRVRVSPGMGVPCVVI